jgi:membrane protein YdbS with pleckstrin-like domain
MITYRCPTCQRPLEVDDDLAGKRAACPHCSAVADVPVKSARAEGVPVARPAGGRVDVTAGDEEDRAVKMGLPPDSGPERPVMTVHPVMFRARPLMGVAAVGLVVAGVVGVVLGLTASVGAPWAVWPGAFLIVAGLIWIGVWKVASLAVALEITNKRTVERRGLLSRRTREILHDKVQDLQLSQTFMQRMLNVGTIGVSSAGEADVEIQVEDLPDPVRIREVIDAYREIG